MQKITSARGWLGLGPTLLLLAACSGSAQDGLEGTGVLPALSPEEMEAEFQQKLSATLSPTEERAVLASLAAVGVPAADIEFRGRWVVHEGDMLLDADELLAGSMPEAYSEKGRFYSGTNVATSGMLDCSYVPQCGGIAPTQMSRLQGSQFQYKRPDTTFTYYLVINPKAGIDASETATLASWLAGAVGRIFNASPTDCLQSTLFQVVTLAQYQALTNPGWHFVTNIIPYENNSANPPCSIGAGGCANLAGDRYIKFFDSTQTILSPRLRFGDRVGLNMDTLELVESRRSLPTTDPNFNPNGAVGVILHELMHTMGYAHTAGGEPATVLQVPGSSPDSNPNFNNASVPAGRKGSVMRTALSDMDRWACQAGESGLQCLPLDDEILLTKIYNGSCAFSTAFRNANP
jgi:hypothetical protein